MTFWFYLLGAALILLVIEGLREWQARRTFGDPEAGPAWVTPDILVVMPGDRAMIDAGYELGWYHRDETEDLHGPFDSKEEAETALKLYCHYLEYGPIEPVL